MSIKAIARDLYRAQQKVNEIEKKMETAGLAEQDNLRGELRVASNEFNILKRMLDGEKESSDFRKKFQGFGQ
ncbi:MULTISPECIES: hypothetical protein [Desulfosediminicola]|uniref:hypothetical protein n=1 Tax=Desulfosediminicola TaxID=2886823 RepID=UPI0010AC25E8|nr:hypothetical protein [Desulfosediminicola ganghwensis]